MDKKELEIPMYTPEHEHTHKHTSEHTHTHSHTQTKLVLNRMAKIIGHLEATKSMVEDGRDCTEVLNQLAAIRSAVNGVSKIIMMDHMEHCIVDAVRDNDEQAMENMQKAIDKFLK
jgi:CsoR family transcriptional regulator, copper-sensing transcriptional repressor